MMDEINAILNSFKESHKEICPILVLAPTQRCGSTLLQRSINAGEEAIIYGENFLLAEKLPETIIPPFTNFAVKKETTDATNDLFFSGAKGMDATALWPPFDAYANHVVGIFYEMLRFYQQSAEAKQYRYWGLKHQLVDNKRFHNFTVMLPNTKVVGIYRNLVDVAKSHKARWPDQLDTPKKLVAYGERWASNLDYLLNRMSMDRMIIKYEDLIANKEAKISNIEKLLGIKLSREVFDKRVNAHLNKDELAANEAKNEGKYIKPKDLSDGEIKALLTHAEPLMRKLGYL